LPSISIILKIRKRKITAFNGASLTDTDLVLGSSQPVLISALHKITLLPILNNQKGDDLVFERPAH